MAGRPSERRGRGRSSGARGTGPGFDDARAAQLARWAALTPLERLRMPEGLWGTARRLEAAGRRACGEAESGR